MKTAIRKSSSVIHSIKLVMNLLVESFESPQTRQFRRLKRFVTD